MMRKCFKKNFLFALGLTLLILNVLNISFPKFSIIVKADESSSVSKDWFFNGWGYRKEHNITRVYLQDSFYALSDPWTTISGNPTFRHAFQPVHTTTIVEVNKVVDGAVRKYLAYDGASPQNSPPDSEIRLYYTDDLDGQWTPYSGNPILGPTDRRFSWPSVVYVDGIFHMFLTNRINYKLERWTSANGINFHYQEDVIVGGNQWKNPFVWLNPNDNKWYLYWHDSSGITEYFKVRSATNIEDLDSASDIIVLSRTIPFGSPTIMYYDNLYWLLGEALEGGIWRVVAYYSSTSPSSGFIECKNSPILSNDEACPMLFLTSDQTRAYLFTNRDSSRWYQETREVYLSSSNSPEPSNIKDYQVKIVVYYGSGTDYGQNVYLNGHSKADFSDVRFTWFNYSSGLEVECSFWIEETVNANHAVFWVKIPEISSGDTTIYIYYGKTDVITTSNGEATFEFFDDFNSDLSKWTVVGGTWSIENGELSGETNAFGQRIRANGFTFNNHAVHVEIKWISGTYFEHGPFVRGQLPNEQNNGYHTHLSTWPFLEKHRIGKMENGAEYVLAIQGTVNPLQNVWYQSVFELYGGALKASFSPLYPEEISAIDSAFSSGTLCLFTWSAMPEHVHYDNLFVRKYVDPEPDHGVWGSEEQAGAAPTPSISVSNISLNSTIASKPCNFSAIFTAQNSNLSHYIFGTNNTGVWINDTAVSFGEGKNQALASIVKSLNSTIGATIQWQIWANNTAGNWTSTGIQTLTTSGNLSTVATLPTYGYAAIEYACQRKTFYANGRFWVFYYDGASSAGYSTSTDGFTWSSFTPFTPRECGAGWRFAVTFDGTKLHYVFSTGVNGDPLYYSCGLLNADGTITWLDNEQNITIGEIDTGHLWPSIAIDSEGRPWVAYARKNATENSRYAYVTTSSTSNGTWITAPGFPYRLSPTNFTGINVMIVPLTNQKMLAIVSCGGWQIESYLWNGSSWSEKQTTASAITSDGIIECGLSAVNQGDDVHLVFVKNSTHDLIYTRYSYASNFWGPETIVHPTVTSETSPVLSIDVTTNKLYCFWAGAPTANRIYYKVYDGSAWNFVEGSNPWIIESNLAGYYQYDGLSGFYQSYDNLLGLAYTNGADGVYQLKFAFLTAYAGEYVIIDQALVSDGRADIDSTQTIWFHAKWSNNGSDVIQGSIYVNGTKYITNSTGWISFPVTSSLIGKQEWAVTAVNCGGVTTYMQAAPNPSIIWDQIEITNGGTTKESVMLGETTTIWFQAKYQYDNTIFDSAHGKLYVNDSQMSWSLTNNRWEYQYTPANLETQKFTISAVQDSVYGLTIIDDKAGAQTINVWSTPFLIISNSTITELTFDSTTKTITFTVTGPNGTIGYTNITIAKSLIQNITDLTIYIDGNQTEYTAISTEYAWLIHFSYTHSTHKVAILLSALNAISLSRLTMITALSLSGILIAIAISLITGKKLTAGKYQKPS